MPNIIEITDFSAPELDVYARLTQAQLRNRLEPEKGVFIAESFGQFDKTVVRSVFFGNFRKVSNTQHNQAGTMRQVFINAA